MEGLDNANGGPILGEGRVDGGLEPQGGSNETVSTVHCNEEFTGEGEGALLDDMKTESIPGKICELKHTQIQSEDQTHPQNEESVPTHMGEHEVLTHPCGQTCPQNEDVVPTHPRLEGERARPQNENEVHNVSQSDGGSLQNANDMDTRTQERASTPSSAEDEDVLFVIEKSPSGGVNGECHVTETTNDTTEFGRVGRTNGIGEMNGIGHVAEITSSAPIEAKGLCSRDEMTSADMASHHQGCASENDSMGLTQRNNADEQDIEVSGEDDRNGGKGGGKGVCGDRVASDAGEGDKGGGGRGGEVGKDGDVLVDEDMDKSVSGDETSSPGGASAGDAGVGAGRDLLARIRQLEGENAELAAQLAAGKEKEDSFQEIATELEAKCFQQQERIEELEMKNEQEIVQTQQQEKQLLLKVDQVREELQSAGREKSSVIDKLAVLQEEQRKLIDIVTDKDKKIKEVAKDNEKLEILVKKQRAEVLKLQANVEKSETRCSQLTLELTKEKAEVNSLNIKVKWAQNKLKTDTEAHKNVKAQLEATSKKLKQAQEEGGQIRADMKQMIQQYQESEDMRSNSLDIKLKKAEKELKQQEQEISDQQELHDLTVKELELAKASHKISQEEVQHHKQKLTELNGRVTELITEIEEQKGMAMKHKQENKRLTAEMAELDQRTQGFEKEHVKFSQLREVFTQLQKSHQQLEKELEKRKERESELLAFSAKLSSSNAELTAERADWEAKVTTVGSERDAMASSLSQTQAAHTQLQCDLEEVQEGRQLEVASMLTQLEGKTRAVEQLSIALEDERESIKAMKKKHSNVIRDLQKQLQSSNRRVEQLEASIASEREPPATLPISRASSHSSLDGVIGTSSTPPIPPLTMASRHLHSAQDTPLTLTTVNENVNTDISATITLSDDEPQGPGATPSPELRFSTMDQEKMMLVEKLCSLKKEVMKQEEKVEFFEEHIAQLTEDIQQKSKIIQSFIMREQTGALAPPSFDENKLWQVRRGGVMGSVFSGKNSRAYKMPEVNYELSLEMNRKMQSVLEDTLLKNITLKENIDTLGREIQRISAQLQTYEKFKR